MAHPTGSRLLKVPRKQLVRLSGRHVIPLQQSNEREGPKLRRRAGVYAHARQFQAPAICAASAARAAGADPAPHAAQTGRGRGDGKRRSVDVDRAAAPVHATPEGQE